VTQSDPQAAFQLGALSPLDGRYAGRLKAFADAFSEEALIRRRVEVEVAWFIKLAGQPEIVDLPALTADEENTLRSWVTSFGAEDARRVKEIDARINHDVKSIEYYLKERLEAIDFGPRAEFVHFACTSEDINNIAHALMVREGLTEAWMPLVEQLVDRLAGLAARFADLPMLSHTHGQPATPTTLGKEFAVFVARWRRQLDSVRRVELLGKFNGATGTFGAHTAAYPDAPWMEISREFVESFGLVWNPLTTQIESHDYLAEIFHAVMRANAVLVDFCQDIWSYISMSYLRQSPVAEEVGSSVMPHKVNPIDFENAEANAQMSSAVLGHLAGKLMVSRLQRDLSDSTALRNVGSGLAYSGLAFHSAFRGLSRIDADAAAISADLVDEWSVLGEAVQTVMRRYGFDQPYERLKALTRGSRIEEEDLRVFVKELGLPPAAELQLLALRPETYIGLAQRLAQLVDGAEGASR
jgi:adenylosuccinate lyase